MCRTEQRHQFATSVQLLEQNLLEQNGPPGDTAPGRKLQCSKRPVRAIGACEGPGEEEENGGQKKFSNRSSFDVLFSIETHLCCLLFCWLATVSSSAEM